MTVQCIVDLPATGNLWLAITLATLAVVSFLGFVPAAIIRHRVRGWLLIATLLLVGAALYSAPPSPLFGTPGITVSDAWISIDAGTEQVDLPIEAPEWTGVRRPAPHPVVAEQPETAGAGGAGWYRTGSGERLFVASSTNPTRVSTTAGFDLVLDWNTVIDLESCVVQVQAARRVIALGF